jgi:signal peptide peptidase SppA
MKYSHVLMAVTEELWALREDKLQAILDFLEVQASGAKFSAEEIEARITKQQEREVAQAEGAVAIIPLRGVIANRMGMFDDISGGTSSEGFNRAFQGALRDNLIKAIILDVDSPGGAVSGAAEASAAVFAARGTKPIIAHVNATAASAAYWIASAADEIVVTQTGSVGSIGVLAVHDDVSGAMEKVGLKKTIIKAGERKVEGHPYAPLTEDVHARMQARVDAAYDMFVRDVARNRSATLDAVRNGFGLGGMVDAAEAIKEGMADRVATLEETLQRFGASQFGAAPKRGASRQRAALDL